MDRNHNFAFGRSCHSTGIYLVDRTISEKVEQGKKVLLGCYESKRMCKAFHNLTILTDVSTQKFKQKFLV